MICASRAPDITGVRTYRGRAALVFLGARWPALYSADPAASPFQSHPWLTAWAHQLPAGATVLVLSVVGSGGESAALALVDQRDGDGRSRVLPLGSPWSEYVGPVGPGADHPAVAVALADALRGLASTASVVLPDIPATSGLGRALSARPAEWDRSSSPYAVVGLPLPEPRGRDHRRRRTRWAALDAAGRVEYRRTRDTPELLAALRDLTSLHSRRWASATPSDAPWPDVLRRCGSGFATIATLLLDGEPVAAQLLLYRGRRLYSLLTGWEPRHRNLSPGHALLRAISEEIAPRRDDGQNVFDSLDLGRTIAGQVAYKALYGPMWGKVATFTGRVSGTHR